MTRKTTIGYGGNINYRKLATTIIMLGRAYQRAINQFNCVAAMDVYQTFAGINTWAWTEHRCDVYHWFSIGRASIR